MAVIMHALPCACRLSAGQGRHAYAAEGCSKWVDHACVPTVAEAEARNADLELAALAEVLPAAEQRGGGISAVLPLKQQQQERQGVAGDSAYIMQPEAAAGSPKRAAAGPRDSTPCGSPAENQRGSAGKGAAREPLAQLCMSSPALGKRAAPPNNAEPGA